MTGDSAQVAVCAGLPPIAVPITVKMPEPITAPTPSAVSETGPSDFFSAVSGRSLSAISLSMDLVAKICRVCVFWRLWIAGGRCQILVEEDWSADEADCMRNPAQGSRKRAKPRLRPSGSWKTFVEKLSAVYLSLRLAA